MYPLYTLWVIKQKESFYISFLGRHYLPLPNLQAVFATLGAKYCLQHNCNNMQYIV